MGFARGSPRSSRSKRSGLPVGFLVSHSARVLSLQRVPGVLVKGDAGHVDT